MKKTSFFCIRSGKTCRAVVSVRRDKGKLDRSALDNPDRGGYIGIPDKKTTTELKTGMETI